MAEGSNTVNREEPAVQGRPVNTYSLEEMLGDQEDHIRLLQETIDGLHQELSPILEPVDVEDFPSDPVDVDVSPLLAAVGRQREMLRYELVRLAALRCRIQL